MTSPLLDRVRAHVDPNVAERAAAWLRTSPAAAFLAVDAALTVLLGAAAHHATVPGGTTRLLSWARAAGEDAPEAFSGGPATPQALAAGERLVAALFGDAETAVIARLAAECEVRPAAMRDAFRVSATLLFRILRREFEARGNTADTVASTFATVAPAVAASYPPGLAVALRWRRLEKMDAVAAVNADDEDRRERDAVRRRPERGPTATSWGLAAALFGGMLAALLGAALGRIR
jgi:hypothetical protein